MIFIKALTNCPTAHHILRIRPIITRMYRFSGKKSNINQQLHNLADNLASSNTDDYTNIASNYIQLQQQSFTQYAKQNKNDPQMMLMFLSTFEDNRKIAQYLPMLYAYIDFFEKKQLLLLMEKVLAFKPATKPKIPYPKPLEDIESILVIMNEIYPADALIEWIKLIPTYVGKDYYVLFMGYFSILEKMSPQLKSRNQNLLIKCHEKISNALKDQSQSLQIRLGIITLAFELNYGQAILLLAGTSIDFSSVEAYKNCLLFINIEKYHSKKRKDKEDESGNSPQEAQLQKMLRKITNQIVEQIMQMDFAKFMKIDLLLEMFKNIHDLKQIKGIYTALTDKLLSLIADKNYSKVLCQLTTEELLIIFQALEKHKVNHIKAIKTLLILFSPHLNKMNKAEFIRLLKCLVTYVRQCEDYLINTRQVLEERKIQFNEKQAIKINETLRRVEVLFPKKFSPK